jgi:hypothetical protein
MTSILCALRKEIVSKGGGGERGSDESNRGTGRRSKEAEEAELTAVKLSDDAIHCISIPLAFPQLEQGIQRVHGRGQSRRGRRCDVGSSEMQREMRCGMVLGGHGVPDRAISGVAGGGEEGEAGARGRRRRGAKASLSARRKKCRLW